MDLFQYPLKCREEHVASLTSYISGQADWFHSFQFSGGLSTPGRDPSAKKLHHLCLPPSLAGMSLIDIGAYEGFFSFHAESRGATRVVAADRYVWEADLPALQNFEAVHQSLGSKVERVLTSVEELEGINDQFDISLFLGVLYHTSDMVGYLNNVKRLTKRVCVLETLLDGLDTDEASARLYAPEELNGDSTNWWAPNLRALDTMLRRVGFRYVVLMNFWEVNTINAIRGQSTHGVFRSGRAVLHAYV